MSSYYARIAGWGHYLPKRVLTNRDLERMVDTSDEWIRTRSGIETRHIAGPEDSTSTMALAAGRCALARAGVAPEELDLVIVATGTPDYPGYPATAALVQGELGAGRAAAFDLGAGCSGWLYGIVLASHLIQAGSMRNVLVIASETLSRFTDWQDRTTCVLFGDGAGAIVLQRSDKPGGLRSFVLGSDGSGAFNLFIPAGGSKRPASAETVAAGEHYIKMNGKEIFRWAMRKIPEAVAEVVARAGLTYADIDLLIPHQANVRIIDGALKRLEVDDLDVYLNVQRLGNTSAASIPLALCEAADCGRIRPGDNLCLVAFGAGLSWAALVWTWNS